MHVLCRSSSPGDYRNKTGNLRASFCGYKTDTMLMDPKIVGSFCFLRGHKDTASVLEVGRPRRGDGLLYRTVSLFLSPSCPVKVKPVTDWLNWGSSWKTYEL